VAGCCERGDETLDAADSSDGHFVLLSAVLAPDVGLYVSFCSRIWMI